MARVNKQLILEVATTPTELRELANKLEQRWLEAKWGQDLVLLGQQWLGDDCKIIFVVDQEKMPANEERLGHG